MIYLKNKKENCYCKMEKDSIVYVDINDESLSISFRIIKGNNDYIETFTERIISTHNEIEKDEFDKIFNKTFKAINDLNNNLKI